MINSLHQFQGRIEQLRSFLEDTETINALASFSVSENKRNFEESDIWSHLIHLKARKIDLRVQTYVTGIILLYGLLEQYVEEVLVAYLDELNSTVKNFGDMPEKIKRNHTYLSAQLLINKDLDKYRDRCNEKDIIQRMLSCADNEPFQINALAFTDHKSNFRIEPLNQFFEPAGISGMSSRIKQTDAFKSYSERKFQDQEIDNLPDKVVFADLDDLAWRRNVVAHGWPDDTLSVEMMKERTEFIFALGKSIYEALRQSLIPYIVKHLCLVLPDPVKVFNHSIVCFHLESEIVAQGLQIIACRPNGTYLEGKITKIEVNHVEQAKVIPPVDVACLVDFKAKDNYRYFLVVR